MDSCIIVTERLCLRKWIDADSRSFIDMNMDSEVMQYFPATLTADETLAMIKRIKLSFTDKGFGLFAVEHKSTKDFLGFTGFAVPGFQSFFTPCVEIGWRFKRPAWGQGYATEAATACLTYGFTELGFNKIVSFTAAVNCKSEKLMQRTGMEYLTEFNHPAIDENSDLCRHVLYEISKERFINKKKSDVCRREK